MGIHMSNKSNNIPNSSETLDNHTNTKILKSSFTDEEIDQQRRKSSLEKHAHFNEDEISEWDKIRGTFQKIDEPKTPYINASDEEDLMYEVSMADGHVAQQKNTAFRQKMKTHYGGE